MRKDVGLRLLESVEVADQQSVDQTWTTEIGPRVDDVIGGRVQSIPGEEVFARIDERLDARDAAHNA